LEETRELLEESKTQLNAEQDRAVKAEQKAKDATSAAAAAAAAAASGAGAGAGAGGGGGGSEDASLMEKLEEQVELMEELNSQLQAEEERADAAEAKAKAMAAAAGKSSDLQAEVATLRDQLEQRGEELRALAADKSAAGGGAAQAAAAAAAASSSSSSSSGGVGGAPAAELAALRLQLTEKEEKLEEQSELMEEYQIQLQAEEERAESVTAQLEKATATLATAGLTAGGGAAGGGGGGGGGASSKDLEQAGKRQQAAVAALAAAETKAAEQGRAHEQQLTHLQERLDNENGEVRLCTPFKDSALCTLAARSLHARCTLTARSLLPHCPRTARALHTHFTRTSYALHTRAQLHENVAHLETLMFGEFDERDLDLGGGGGSGRGKAEERAGREMPLRVRTHLRTVQRRLQQLTSTHQRLLRVHAALLLGHRQTKHALEDREAAFRKHEARSRVLTVALHAEKTRHEREMLWMHRQAGTADGAAGGGADGAGGAGAGAGVGAEEGELDDMFGVGRWVGGRAIIVVGAGSPAARRQFSHTQCHAAPTAHHRRGNSRTPPRGIAHSSQQRPIAAHAREDTPKRRPLANVLSDSHLTESSPTPVALLLACSPAPASRGGRSPRRTGARGGEGEQSAGEAAAAAAAAAVNPTDPALEASFAKVGRSVGRSVGRCCPRRRRLCWSTR
jgi:hypothetical protein